MKPNLKNKNKNKYLFVLASVKKKINIDKIRTNSHELVSETRGSEIPKHLELKEFIILLN